MKLQEFLDKYDFSLDTYFLVKDKVVFKKTKAGVLEDDSMKKTTRKIGAYRIVAFHFECTLPYSKYYLITDTDVYESREYLTYTTTPLNEMVEDLKKVGVE